MLQQLAGLIGIARGFELDDLDVETGNGRGEAPGDFPGLRQRHHALARADPQLNCRHSRFPSPPHRIAADVRAQQIKPADAGMQTHARRPCGRRYRASCRIMSEAFSAIMMMAALVLPETRSGM